MAQRIAEALAEVEYEIASGYMLGADPKAFADMVAHLRVPDPSLSQRILAQAMMGVGAGFLLTFLAGLLF